MQISWIIKSYFLIAGGFVLSSIFSALLGGAGVTFLLVMALGAMLGGLFSAKASTGKTIAEPAIGAVLFIVSLISTFYLTEIGELFLKFVFAAAATELTTIVVKMVAASLIGALAGAFLGEKLQGDGGTPGAPFMIFLSCLAVAGGIFMGFFAFSMVLLREVASEAKAEGSAMSSDSLGTLLVLAPLVGAAVGGIVARRSGAKVMLTFLGALVFCGFLFLLTLSAGADTGNSDANTGFAIGAVVIAVCALIGAALGSIGLKKTETSQPT